MFIDHNPESLFNFKDVEIPVDLSLLISNEAISNIESGLQNVLDGESITPETLLQIQGTVNQISETVGIEPVDMSEDVTVSQEGLLSIAIKTVRRIWEFIKSVGRWVKGLFIRTKEEAVKHDVATASAVKTAVAKVKEDDAKPKEEQRNSITIELPQRSLIAFYTSKSEPKTNVSYNENSLRIAMKQIQQDLAVMKSALEEELDKLISTTDTLVTHIENDKPIPDREIFNMRKLGKISALYSGKFTTIGFMVREVPVRTDNEFRKVKYDLTDIIRDKGWDGSYNFTIQKKEVISLGNEIVTTTRFARSTSIELIRKLRDSNVISKLEKLKEPANLADEETGLMSPAKKANNMRRLNVAYELANQLQLLLNTYRQFCFRYGAMLGGIVQQVSKGFD